MDSSGKLSWDVPAGDWKILRFIQRPKNKVERWGERYATYCDLLNPDAVAQAWDLTLAPLLKEMTPENAQGWLAFLTIVMKVNIATGLGIFTRVSAAPWLRPDDLSSGLG